MEASQENYEAALEIIKVLEEKGCTVRRAESILSFVGTTIRDHATVQLSDDLARLLNGTKDFG